MKKKILISSVFEGELRYDYNTITTEEHGRIGAEGYMKLIDKKFNSFNAEILAPHFRQMKTGHSKLKLEWDLEHQILQSFHQMVCMANHRYEIGNSNMQSEQNLQVDFGITYIMKSVKLTYEDIQ